MYIYVCKHINEIYRQEEQQNERQIMLKRSIISGGLLIKEFKLQAKVQDKEIKHQAKEFNQHGERKEDQERATR
jgi:hypothetical protein